MKLISLLIAFTAYVHLALSFQCSDFVQEYCEALISKGCIWDETTSTCSGTFIPGCSNCYFIDKDSTVTPVSGTYSNPYLTLNQGFTKIGTGTGTLFVVNHRENSFVELSAIITANGNVTIL